MSAVPLFEAARLADWGLGLILFYLAATRGLNALHWQFHGRRAFRWAIPEPAVRFSPPRATGGNPTTFFAAVLGLIPIFAFTGPIAQDHVGWLGVGPSPLTSLIAVWLLGACIVFLLWKLAFHPARKMALAAGWVALSHLITWLTYGAA